MIFEKHTCNLLGVICINDLDYNRIQIMDNSNREIKILVYYVIHTKKLNMKSGYIVMSFSMMNSKRPGWESKI